MGHIAHAVCPQRVTITKSRHVATPTPKVLALMPNPLTHLEIDPNTFHQQLARFNVSRLAVVAPSGHWVKALETELEYRVAEGHYLEALRQQVAPLLPRFVPKPFSHTDSFVHWFEALAIGGPGQQHWPVAVP